MVLVGIAVEANDLLALRNGFRLPRSCIGFKENVTGSGRVCELDSVDVLHARHLDRNVCDGNRFTFTMGHSQVHSELSIDVASLRRSQLLTAYPACEVELN